MNEPHLAVAGRADGRQFREALDRLEGLVVDGLRHGFFDYSIACDIGKGGRRQLVIRAGQEPQVHDPRGRTAALKRLDNWRSLRWGRPKMQITARSSVIGGIPRPEARARSGEKPAVRSSVKLSHAANDNLQSTRTPGRSGSRASGVTSAARTPGRSPQNVTGFFSVLAEWSRAEMPSPANDTGKPDAPENGEARHER